MDSKAGAIYRKPVYAPELLYVFELDFGDKRHSYDERHAAHGLLGCDERGPRPVLRQILDLAQQALNPRLGVRNSMNVILEHQLLGDMVEPHRRQPAAGSLGPPLLAGVNAPMPEEKTLQMLPRLANTCTTVARARIKSRITSWPSSGTHTAVNSAGAMEFG